MKLLTVKIVLKFLEIHCVFDVYVNFLINFYLFNFAIIIHARQGHHNSITPITVGLLNIIKIQHKTEIKHNRNLEKPDIKTTLKAHTSQDFVPTEVIFEVSIALNFTLIMFKLFNYIED